MEEHSVSASTYFLRQVDLDLNSSKYASFKVEGLSNACGTIAMLHAILNNRDLLGIEGKDCTLGKFYTDTKNLNAEERGKALDDSADIGSVHNGLVAEGQSHQVDGEKTSISFLFKIGANQGCSKNRLLPLSVFLSRHLLQVTRCATILSASLQ